MFIKYLFLPSAFLYLTDDQQVKGNTFKSKQSKKKKGNLMSDNLDNNNT